MTYLGDFALGETFDCKFTSRRFSTGAPHTLAGTPVISAYPGNSTTQITAGITLSVDFDSVTGLNNVRVVATSGNGYATATNYALVITTGTVDSVSVVGEVVGHFSIENRSGLRPTTAGRTLDVSAGGEAGIDWNNIGSPTTTVALTGTTVDLVANAVDAAALAADALTEILDTSNAVESGVTLRNALKLILAACAGTASGLATATAVYKSADLSGGAVQGTKNRITATVDSDGNRSAITVDLT